MKTDQFIAKHDKYMFLSKYEIKPFLCNKKECLLQNFKTIKFSITS